MCPSQAHRTARREAAALHARELEPQLPLRAEGRAAFRCSLGEAHLVRVRVRVRVRVGAGAGAGVGVGVGVGVRVSCRPGTPR